MQIYNLTKKWNNNHTWPINLWNEWEKKYLKPLESRINSLFDYIYFFNKDYLIINSTNTSEAQIYTENESLETVKQDAINNLCYSNTTGGVTTTQPWYYPWQLLYRQGFINNNTDGKLIFAVKNTSPTTDNSIDLPTGYCCICIHQSENEIEGTFQSSLSLEDYKKRYAIYPISNGGFYIPKSKGNGQIEFRYYENVLGKFINNLPFVWNCAPLRYITQTAWNNETERVEMDYNSANEPNISNIDNLAWTGDKDLTYQFYLNDEEVFCDNVFKFGENVQNYSYRNTMTITLDEAIKLNNLKLNFF